MPLATAAIALLAAFSGNAHAQLYWSGNGSTIGGSGTWDTTNARFGSGTSAPFNVTWDNTTNSGSTADFRTTTGTVTVQAGGISVGTIVPRNASSASPWVFTGGNITLGTAIGATGNATHARFENNIAIPNDVTFIYRTSSTLNISGQLRGAGRVNNNSSGSVGNLTLSGNNSGWSGGMSLSNIVHLTLGHTNALGSGQIDVADTGTTITSTTPVTGSNNFTFAATGASGTSTITLAGSGAMTFTGNMSLTAGASVQTRGFNVTSSEVMTWSGVISQTAGASLARNIVKQGSGTMVLGGNNTYSGNTSVEAGTLLVNGTHTSGSTSSVNVSAGAILGGTGSIGGATAAISGTLAPGLAGQLGTFSFVGNDVSFASGGSLLAQLNSNPAVFTSDLLAISGAGSSLILGGTSTLDLFGPTSFTTSGTYTLATFLAGSGAGQFTTVKYNGNTMTNPTAVGGVTANGQLVYNADSIQLIVVPEPTALALAAAGAALSGLMAWRRRRG